MREQCGDTSADHVVESVYQRKSVHNQISVRMADEVDLSLAGRNDISQSSGTKVDIGGRGQVVRDGEVCLARVSNAQVS